MPAHFPIQDIYGDTVQVKRIDAGKILEGGVLLNGQPVERIFMESDRTVVLMTTSPNE